MSSISSADDEPIDAEVDSDAGATMGLLAGPRETGAQCPGCASLIAAGSEIVVCHTCAKPHHTACWRRNGCGTYNCAPQSRTVLPGEARLVIEADELDRAVTITPRRPAFADFSKPAKPRISRLALASFITALAGIPLFGAVTGLVAIVLACLALAGLQGKKGLVFSVLGLVIGLADVVGWLLFLSAFYMNGPGVELNVKEFNDADIIELKNVQPELYRAMQANVLVQHRAGWAGEASGSGVVMRVDGDEAIVVTNRHVIDDGFPAKTAPPDLEKLGKGSLRVRLLGKQAVAARVAWVAPDGVDLALLRVPLSGEPIEPAPWGDGGVLVGDPVFAIGNPFGLNWSHTNGVVSQIRTMEVGGRRLRVIQTQAAVNPGNSGGGLYDKNGALVGIITWTRDKRVSEGLGFAIGLDALLDLAPPALLGRTASDR
jgi:S1-C subfamily serine protease